MDRKDISKLARLCCDDELSPAQASEWKCCRTDPSCCDTAEEHLAFERKLRECVSACMTEKCECAPPEVCSCIREQLQNASASEASLAGRIESSGRKSKISKPSIFNVFFAGPNRANALAVAATITLITGAVLFGIFGRHIDDSPRTLIEEVSTVSEFVANEHILCATDAETLKKKATANTIEDARALVSEWLNEPVEVFDLKELGYEFCGAGRCAIPISDRSCHLLYRKTAAARGSDRGEWRDGKWGGPMVSIFVIPNQGERVHQFASDLKVGRWDMVPRSPKCVLNVMRATDGQLVYLMVCCSDRDRPTVASTTEPVLASLSSR